MNQAKPIRLIVIGGGAAGFFGAICAAQAFQKAGRPYSIQILERGKSPLQKVKISGGGRCNFTHACFDPNDFSKFYPRGERALRGPFHHFCSKDIIEWFAKNGVPHKVEEDGRIFPKSNTSQSIIDCFTQQIKKYNIQLLPQHRIIDIIPKDLGYNILCKQKTPVYADQLLVAAGSSTAIWKILERLGHRIVPPVPSLFTFNIKDDFLKGLAGLSMPDTQVHTSIKKIKPQRGPLLITHWGLSGPAILKTSAWGARHLHQQDYKFDAYVNWLPHITTDELQQQYNTFRQTDAKRNIGKRGYWGFPLRLWQRFLETALIPQDTNWASISKKQWNALKNLLHRTTFEVEGKSTFKEEFVTAGGVSLKQVNFKTFESKILPNMYFAGEILDIDAITGGFNFQAAWTGAWIAAQAIAQK